MKHIDLHFHLDGAITLDIAKRLAKIQNITLPVSSDEELEKRLTLPSDCKSLVDFLKCFEFPLLLLQTKIGIEEAVVLILEEAKKHGVVYAEIRYAPQLHCNNGLTQEDAIIAAINGVKRAPIKSNLILCCMRGDGNEKENELTVELAKKYLVSDGGVVAVDLAGAESLFPTSKYRELFKKVKDYNIPFTIHSGESEGPEGVKLAIEYGASRIGHGLRIYEDESVMKLVRDSGVTLEMCPTSNVQTCAIPTLDIYPIMKYLDYGIKATVNTDDPGIEGTDLDNEFKLLEKHIRLPLWYQEKINYYAVQAAFTDDKGRKEIQELLK